MTTQAQNTTSMAHVRFACYASLHNCTLFFCNLLDMLALALGNCVIVCQVSRRTTRYKPWTRLQLVSWGKG